MALENRLLLLIGCGLFSTTCVFYTLANILPMWGKYTDDRAFTTFGLWGSCGWYSPSVGDGEWTCRDGVGGSLKIYAKVVAARLFVSIAGILTSFSLLSIMSIRLVDADATKKTMVLLAKVLSIGSLVTGIIGLALGINYVITVIDKKSDPTVTVHIYASSILAILAVIFNLVGGIVAFILK